MSLDPFWLRASWRRPARPPSDRRKEPPKPSLQATASRPFTTLASMLLAVLAIGHRLRLVFAHEVVIGGMIIPLGVSIPVAVLAAGLAYLVWRESHG